MQYIELTAATIVCGMYPHYSNCFLRISIIHP